MKYLFFGNSFTSGENNNNISFARYISIEEEDVIMCKGVSGTTIGEYSIYPTDGYSLLSLIPKYANAIRYADIIFLQYGANDVSSILSGFVSEKVVIVSFVKALDYIRQLNPKAKIYFLTTSLVPSCQQRLAKAQCDYLKKDYFKGYDIDVPVMLWQNTYSGLMNIFKSKVPMISMIDDVAFFDTYISSDNVHPNNEGHIAIANTIRKYINL